MCTNISWTRRSRTSPRRMVARAITRQSSAHSIPASARSIASANRGSDMAKDALGHGSNGRGGLSSAGHFMYRAQIGSGVPHNLALERVGFAFPSDYAAADALKGG